MSEWKPIESAPRDGTVVDLWAQERERYEHERITDCKVWKGVWCHTTTIFDEVTLEDMTEVFNPTHWMPLPEPPEAAE